MRFNVVYMITHNVTKRMYIGSTKNYDRRIKLHFNHLRNGNHPVEDMQRDFDLYGEDYTVEILKETDDFKYEYEMMERYRSRIRGIGYNYKDNHYRPKKTGYYLVKRLMRNRGITYARIGEIIGYSTGVASMKINGKYPITLKEAIIIRDFIAPGVLIEKLFEVREVG